MMKTLLSLSLTFLFAFNSIALGQTPQQTQKPQETEDVIRINTELVQTDVTVFDKSGRFIDGLKPEQFEVRVDGKPVIVSFVERVTAGSTREAMLETATSRPAKLVDANPGVVDRGRTIVFFLDDYHLSAASVENTRKSILRFIENEMALNDQVAVSSSSGQIGYLQQFTDNKAVLRAAVARISHRPYTVRDAENIAMTEYTALKIDQGDRDALSYFTDELLKATNFRSAGGGLGPPKSTPFGGGSDKGQTQGMTRESAERVVKERAQVLLKQSAAVTIDTLSSLESLMRSSAQLPGRKLVFFISDGFYLNDRNTGYGDKLKRITDAAVRAGVVIYSLDARGLISETDAGSNRADPMGKLSRANTGEVSASQDPLTALAGDTGGRALLNSGALNKLVNDALKETSNYYLLAWKPVDDQRGGKFKRIEVSIAGRPDLTVRLPRGYLDMGAKALAARDDSKPGKPAETAGNSANQGGVPKTTDAELRTALNSFAPLSNVPTYLNVSYLDTPNNAALLTASVQISTARLSYGADGKQPAAVDLAGVILNEQGKSVNGFKTRLNVNPLSSTADAPEQGSVIYNYKVALPPGLYQVRTAARDEKSGWVGSAHQWIEIPDLTNKRLTLSSLLIGGQVIEKTGQKQGTDAAAGNAGGPQVQFSVDKRFKRSAKLSFWIFIYNAARGAGGSAQPDLTAQVQVFRGSQAIVTTPARKLQTEGMSDLARIPYGGEFPLGSLAPGRYMLQVTVTDKLGNATAMRHAFFDIE
jgi:VWFA-related protein